jgi:hypothetical protein
MAEHILSTTLQQLDDEGQTIARRQTSYSDTDPSVGENRVGLLTDTSEATISLPITQPRQVAITNTHASAKITVKWTPTGVAKVTIIILGPGDGIAFWNQNTGATYGISALYLTSDVANATYELFIGG